MGQSALIFAKKRRAFPQPSVAPPAVFVATRRYRYFFPASTRKDFKMAKLSGFFMSTLLIVLCLWINVCHYPDAARSAPVDLPDATVPVDETRFPAAAPSDEANEKTDAQETTAARGLLVADAEDVADAPELLDVSASRSNDENAESAPETPALKPASFPDEAAEIDDATPQSAAPSAPASFDVSDVAAEPSSATVPASSLASNAVGPRVKSLRPSATKPRGAKYVRVPDVEIDAFSGNARSVDASADAVRVVGATRAGQTERVPAPVR